MTTNKDWNQIKEEIKSEWGDFKKCTCRTFRDKCNNCLPSGDVVEWFLSRFKPYFQEEMHDKAVEEFSKSETCGEERGTGESVLFYNEKVWDEDAKLIAQKYAVKPESSWEECGHDNKTICGNCQNIAPTPADTTWEENYYKLEDQIKKLEKEAYERGWNDGLEESVEALRALKK